MSISPNVPSPRESYHYESMGKLDAILDTGLWIDLRLTDFDDLAGPSGLQGFQARGEMLQDIRQAVRLHTKNQDSDFPARNVLLIFYIPINGEEYVPMAFCQV